MAKLANLAIVLIFAAVAGASLVGLATAAPENIAKAQNAESCDKVICFVSLF